jgi:hypothetical protein
MYALTADDEQRLHQLAAGLAKDVEDTDALLARLGFTRDDYNELAETRAFRAMLDQALGEWAGANNTHKRIKLKAAVNVEQALPHFFHAMIDPKEPLSSKVKAFEIVSRVAGLGNPEPTHVGNGQYFKLEINLGGGKTPLIIENVSDIDPRNEVSGGFPGSQSGDLPQLSPRWIGREKESL